MPKKTYYLEEGKEDPLHTSWGFAWKNFTITYQGKEVGVIPNQKALKVPSHFTLEDGRNITVQLVTGMQPYLDIQLNGKPLSGSAGDPLTKIKGAAIYTWCMGGLISIVSMLLSTFLGEYWILAVLEGLVFVGLGFWIWFSKSTASVIITMILAIIQAIMVLSLLVQADNPRITGGIVIKVFWIVTLFRAIPATKEIDSNPELDDILDA